MLTPLALARRVDARARFGGASCPSTAARENSQRRPRRTAGSSPERASACTRFTLRRRSDAVSEAVRSSVVICVGWAGGPLTYLVSLLLEIQSHIAVGCRDARHKLRVRFGTQAHHLHGSHGTKRLTS